MIFHFSSITLNHSESHPPLKRSALYQTIFVARFIQHLANGTTLSIVTFGMQARLVLPPTVVTDTNRESLYGRVRMVLVIMTLIMVVVLMMMSAVVVMVMLVLGNYFAVQVPRRQGEDSNGCLHCALNVSLAALSDYKGRPRWQMMVKTMVAMVMMTKIIATIMIIHEVNISLAE